MNTKAELIFFLVGVSLVRTPHFCRPSTCVLPWPLHLRWRAPLPLRMQFWGSGSCPRGSVVQFFLEILELPRIPPIHFSFCWNFARVNLWHLEPKKPGWMEPPFSLKGLWAGYCLSVPLYPLIPAPIFCTCLGALGD